MREIVLAVNGADKDISAVRKGKLEGRNGDVLRVLVHGIQHFIIHLVIA